MDNVFLHPTAIIEAEKIGRGTSIWAFTHVMKDVSIGENCNIGDHCFIETGVVIGNNTTIGEFAMVGAGAIVIKDVPLYALVVGNPARGQGWVCQCGQPLTFQNEIAQCKDCGLGYVKNDGNVKIQ